MTTITKTAITPIVIGDSVEPSIANTPHDNLETNIDNLIAYIKSSTIGAFEYNSVASTGLIFEYDSGTYNNRNVSTAIAAGNRSLTASVTSYVEINTSTGAVTHNNSAFTAANIPLWEVVTDGSSITGVTDRRSSFFLRNTLGIDDSSTTTQLTLNDTTAAFIGDITVPDTKKMILGTGLDLQIYHSSTNSYLDSYTGLFILQQKVNSGFLHLRGNDSGGTPKDCIIVGDTIPYVRMFYDGIEKLRTTTGGIQSKAVSTESSALTMGTGRSGNGYAYVDLIGDTTYSTYGLRILRSNTGANTDSVIEHRGTGALRLKVTEAGSIELQTSSITGLSMDSNQNITLSGATTHNRGDALSFIELTNTTTTNELHLRTYTANTIGFRPAPLGVADATDDFVYDFANTRWQFDKTPYVGSDPIAILASPVFTGNPTAPTPTAGDNDTSIATTAFVSTAISTAHDDQVQTLGSIEKWTGVQNSTTLTWDGTVDSFHIFSGAFALIGTAGSAFTAASQRTTWRKFLATPTQLFDDSYGAATFNIFGFTTNIATSVISDIPTCYILNFHNYTSGNATVSFSITVYNYGDDDPEIRLLNNGVVKYTSGTAADTAMTTFTGSFTVPTATTANITLEGRYSVAGSGVDAFLLNSINYMRVTF